MLFDYENSDTRDMLFKIKSSGVLQLSSGGDKIRFIRDRKKAARVL